MSRSTTRAVLFATLASVQATAATASDMSAVSSHRWCYRQMQELVDSHNNSCPGRKTSN